MWCVRADRRYDNRRSCSSYAFDLSTSLDELGAWLTDAPLGRLVSVIRRLFGDYGELIVLIFATLDIPALKLFAFRIT